MSDTETAALPPKTFRARVIAQRVAATAAVFGVVVGTLVGMSELYWRAEHAPGHAGWLLSALFWSLMIAAVVAGLFAAAKWGKLAL